MTSSSAMKKGLRGVTFIWLGNPLVFYYPSASEIWFDNRGQVAFG